MRRHLDLGRGLAVVAVLAAMPAAAQSTGGTDPSGTPAAQAADTAATPQDVDGTETTETGGQSDIVVTARKREETLVRVPEAITAFNADRIDDAGIRTLRDFADLTPNLNITSGQGVSYPAITIRGLAQAQTGEAPVAVVIDGVQLSEPSFITQDFGDVDRIEVLRGPQGSLYGRNAIGGAINIVTKQPTNEAEGRLKIQYGNADRLLVSGQYAGPIIADKVLYSFGGTVRRTDGQLPNVFAGGKADRGEQYFLRGRLIFNLSNEWQLDLRGNYGNDRVGNPTAEIVTYDQFDDFKPGFLLSNAPVIERRELYDLSAKLEYGGEAVTITSITGYSEVDGQNLGDADFTPAAAVIQNVQRRVDAFTQELRISSSGSGRFRWLLGGFYQDRSTDNFLELFADDGAGRASAVQLSGTSQDVGTSESLAGFGSASFDILPTLELTVGARYDRDKRTSVDRARQGSDTRATFKAFQPKVQLSYKPNPNLNFYATYSEGFGSGGFNSFVTVAQSRRYDEQTAENYEVGFKGSLLNGRVTVTASGFRVTYEGQQFFFVTINPPTQNILNIDRTRVNGAELDVVAQVTDRFSVTGGLGISDAEIRRNDALPETVGNDSPQNFPYTVNASAQYTLPLGADLDLRAYGSYRRQGETFWNAANTLRTPAKDFVNIRLFLEGDGWSFGGFVNNLNNTQYPTIAAALTGLPVALRVPSPRRFYGAEASFRF